MPVPKGLLFFKNVPGRWMLPKNGKIFHPPHCVLPLSAPGGAIRPPYQMMLYYVFLSTQMFCCVGSFSLYLFDTLWENFDYFPYLCRCDMVNIIRCLDPYITFHLVGQPTFYDYWFPFYRICSGEPILPVFCADVIKKMLTTAKKNNKYRIFFLQLCLLVGD